MKTRDVELYYKALEKCLSKNIGDIMSKNLQALNGKSAEKILKLSGEDDNVPVNLEKILRKINIHKRATTFEEIEEIEKNGKIAGLVLLKGEEVGIFYDAEAPLSQKRFTVAHEIGHCCLHGDILKDGYIEFLHEDGYEDSHETEATVFAAKLLIPEKPLLQIHGRLIRPSIRVLSDIFRVPIHLMKRRLDELGLTYYEEEKGLGIWYNYEGTT